jgi:hypothetical protein
MPLRIATASSCKLKSIWALVAELGTSFGQRLHGLLPMRWPK